MTERWQTLTPRVPSIVCRCDASTIKRPITMGAPARRLRTQNENGRSSVIVEIGDGPPRAQVEHREGACLRTVRGERSRLGPNGSDVDQHGAQRDGISPRIGGVLSSGIHRRQKRRLGKNCL